MIIRLDGVEYTVPAEQEARMIQQMNAAGMESYEKLSLEVQLLVTGLARAVLSFWETKVRKTQGKEASLLLRPPKGPDGKKVEPALHLSSMLARQVQAMVKYAELTIETDGSGTTTAFSFSIPTKDQEGRSLVPNGDIGQRQNYGAQIS